MNAVLEQTLAFVRGSFDRFELIESSSEPILSGRRANFIHARFLMHADHSDGRERTFPVESRMYTIFTPRVVFSLGMSGSTDRRYAPPEDFQAILESVRC